MKTKNLSKRTIREAVNVSGGLYHMNAKTSVGYAFTKNARNNAVNIGEFIFPCELEGVNKERFDGYIDFETKKLTDLESGEIISIE